MIVPDASVAIEVLLRTAVAEPLEDRLFAFGETPHALHLLDVEVARVLRRHTLSGNIDAGRRREALENLAGFPLVRYPHDFLLPRIWRLRENVTACDAAYIALSEALDASLLASDRRLSIAHHAQVELFRRPSPGMSEPLLRVAITLAFC